MSNRSRRLTLTPAPHRPDLDALLEKARTIVVTKEQLREQGESLARAYIESLKED